VRYVKSGQCVACTRARAAARYAADPESKRARMRAYYVETAEDRCNYAADRYYALDSLAYNRRLLQVRRSGALRRLEERNGKVSREDA
jgi:hypothetical protein